MEQEKNALHKLVDSIIKNLSGDERLGEEEILGAWQAAVGEQAAKHTRPVSFKKSSLTVHVDGSSWLYELTLKKREILKHLEGKIKGKKVKDIRFRIGELK